MATCLTCGTKNNVEITPTYQTKFKTYGEPSASGLAGGQLKVNAFRYQEYRLDFLCCNQYVLGYLDSKAGYFVAEPEEVFNA